MVYKDCKEAYISKFNLLLNSQKSLCVIFNLVTETPQPVMNRLVVLQVALAGKGTLSHNPHLKSALVSILKHLSLFPDCYVYTTSK